MSPKRVSVKLTPGKQRQLESALALLEAHIAPLAEVWPELLPEQRASVLAHCPILTRVVGLAERFR